MKFDFCSAFALVRFRAVASGDDVLDTVERRMCKSRIRHVWNVLFNVIQGRNREEYYQLGRLFYQSR
jgi:hypothetical protein